MWLCADASKPQYTSVITKIAYHLPIHSDVVCMNFSETIDDDGVCTTVLDPCLSCVNCSFLRLSRFCIVTEIFVEHVWRPCHQVPAEDGRSVPTENWSVIDEWSFELILQRKPMFKRFSVWPLQPCSKCGQWRPQCRCFPVFYRVFWCQLLKFVSRVCVAQSESLVNFALHVSHCNVVFVTLA